MKGPRLVLLRDDTTTGQHLRNIKMPGVAVAEPTPMQRRRRIGRLAEHVLEAVGISGDVAGVGRNDTDDWQLAHLHLAHRNIRHLIVIDSHLLNSYELQHIIELTYATATDLWLVAYPDHVTDEHLKTLARWPATTEDPELFASRFLQDPAATPADKADSDLQVRVPATTFLTFRADVRELLDTDEHAAVEERYLAAHRAASELAANDTLDEDTVAAWLTRQLAQCATVEQMLTTVRATQAQLLVAGWYLQVDLDAFLGANQQPHTAATRSRETWRRVGAYRQPYRTAACALAGANLTLQQMRELRIADVADDASHVTVDGQQVPIETDAQTYLALQRLARQIDGAQPDDVLLADQAGTPCSNNQLKRAVTDPAAELGVALISGQVVRRTVNPSYWTRRQGLSVQPLANKAR